MNDLIPFTYQNSPVRVVDLNGEPWFVLADLCNVLDLSNPTMVANRLDQVNLSQAEVQNSRGQTRSTLIVSEAGMYEVVIRSTVNKVIRGVQRPGPDFYEGLCRAFHVTPGTFLAYEEVKAA